MANIWVVIKHEIGVTIRKKSFWILSFIVPVFLLGFQAYYIILEEDVTAVGEDGEEEAQEEPAAAMQVVGLVDEAGIISTYPDGIPPGMFVEYESPDQGMEALETGAVDQVVLIPADYVTSGDVTIYDQDFQILDEANTGVAMSNANEWMLQYILSYNLIGDPELATILFNPTPGDQANFIPLELPEGEPEGDAALAQFTSTAIPYIYYFILIIVSGYILQSVTAEKENRTVEVILVSMDSNELMAGKLLGMTFVALLQLLVLAGGAAFLISYQMTPIYEASATMLINQAPSSNSSEYAALLTSQRLAETYAQMLTTQPIIDGVIDSLGLNIKAAKLEDNISVRPIQDTQLIRVNVQHTNPVTAAQIAARNCPGFQSLGFYLISGIFFKTWRLILLDLLFLLYDTFNLTLFVRNLLASF